MCQTMTRNMHVLLATASSMILFGGVFGGVP